MTEYVKSNGFEGKKGFENVIFCSLLPDVEMLSINLTVNVKLDGK